MLPLVLIIIAIVAIVAITGLVSEVRAGVVHDPIGSWIDSYDEDSLREVAEELVVEDLGNYTITSFVTKRRVMIQLCDDEGVAVFIRVTRDDWAFFMDGGGVLIPEKAEVKIYSSVNEAYLSGDEFMTAHLFRLGGAELVLTTNKTVLKGIAKTIEPIWIEYGKVELTGIIFTLNKDAMFAINRMGFAFVEIEGGKEPITIQNEKAFYLPKGARLSLAIPSQL
jgi:hypothetical protein